MDRSDGPRGIEPNLAQLVAETEALGLTDGYTGAAAFLPLLERLARTTPRDKEKSDRSTRRVSANATTG